MNDVAGRAALPGGGGDHGDARFRAIATAVVPEAAKLTEDEWGAAAAIIARAVASRPRAMRRQLGVFIRALDLLSLVRRGRSFSSLRQSERSELLEWLGASPLLALRRGVWGVRTLAFMGYYARAEAAKAIGYQASADGWTARRDASASR